MHFSSLACVSLGGVAACVSSPNARGCSQTKLESSVYYMVPSGLLQDLIMTQANVACFQIERLRIGHDSKGDGKGIFVEEVEVAPADGDRAIFPCYCWLTEGKGDKKIERDVLPGQPRPPRPSKCYIMTTVASD